MSFSSVGVVAALLLTQSASVMENSAGSRRSTTTVSEPGDRRPQTGRGTGEARDVRVCRQERVIGSNFSRRVCRSRDLSAQARDDSQDGLREIQGARFPDEQ